MLTDTDHGSSLLGGILRFVIFIPLEVYETTARNHWKVIATHEYLQSSMWNPPIVKGEHMAASWVSLRVLLW